MKNLILILVMLGFGSQSLATGGTYCQLETDEILVDISLVNSRMMGAPVYQGQADVLLKETNESLRYNVDDELVGWWSMGDDTKMLFYKWNEDSESNLRVEVSYSDVHETYLGMLYFTNSNGVEIAEIISCELE